MGGFKAFQEVDDYLRNLATVKSITLMQSEQDRVIYLINYLSSKNSLIQEIRLGDLLNSVERSRVDSEQYDNANSSSSYKPVILGNLDDKNMSDREKVLNSLEHPKANSQEQALNAVKNGTSTTPVVAEKTVERLIPELEYWLAR